MAMLTVLMVLVYDYCLPVSASPQKCSNTIPLTRANYLQILISLETIIALPVLIIYLGKCGRTLEPFVWKRDMIAGKCKCNKTFCHQHTDHAPPYPVLVFPYLSSKTCRSNRSNLTSAPPPSTLPQNTVTDTGENITFPEYVVCNHSGSR